MDKNKELCSHNSLREKVAIFIDNSPTLNHFKGKKYYQLEDELVEFIASVVNEDENER